MIALILAAGYGTRLYPLTKDTPKPLLPIQGRPLVDYLLDKLASSSELKSIYLVTNDKFAGHFERWAMSHKNFKAPVNIVNDGTTTNENRLGSMGDIKFVLNKIGRKDDLLVLGGDNLFDENLGGFLKMAQTKKPRVTVGVFDIKNKEEAKIYGVLELDNQKRIKSFEEKPAQPKSSLIGMCLYYLTHESLGRVEQYLNESKKSDTSGDYIKWLYQREEVYAFTFHGRWYDIGSLEAYDEAQKEFNIPT